MERPARLRVTPTRAAAGGQASPGCGPLGTTPATEPAASGAQGAWVGTVGRGAVLPQHRDMEPGGPRPAGGGSQREATEAPRPPRAPLSHATTNLS